MFLGRGVCVALNVQQQRYSRKREDALLDSAKNAAGSARDGQAWAAAARLSGRGRCL